MREAHAAEPVGRDEPAHRAQRDRRRRSLRLRLVRRQHAEQVDRDRDDGDRGAQRPRARDRAGEAQQAAHDQQHDLEQGEAEVLERHDRGALDRGEQVVLHVEHGPERRRDDEVGHAARPRRPRPAGPAPTSPRRARTPCRSRAPRRCRWRSRPPTSARAPRPTTGTNRSIALPRLSWAMMPSRPSVDTTVVLTPTVAGSNIRAATTQYSMPTAEEIAELRTSAIPSRFCGSRQPLASAFSRAAAGHRMRVRPRRRGDHRVIMQRGLPQPVGRLIPASTARWSLPATGRTAKRVVVASSGTSTWSIWMPHHDGTPAGNVPTRPWPVPSAALRQRRSTARNGGVVGGGVEVARHDRAGRLGAPTGDVRDVGLATTRCASGPWAPRGGRRRSSAARARRPWPAGSGGASPGPT